MIRSFLLILTLFTLNINLLASSEDEFWKAINSGDYQKCASIGEELAQSKIDYLYLTAVSNHMIYDYLTFSGMSEYYKQTVHGDYSSLSKLLSLHYQENNFNSNNLLGIIKNSLTEIQLKEAEWYFKKSLQLEANNSIANNYLSMIENIKGNYDQAIKHSKKSIKLNPNYPEPYNNLTFSYYKQGMEQMAIDNLVICMQNCPKNNSSTYINYIQLACEEVVVMNGNLMFGAPRFKEPKVREELIKT